MGKHRHNVVFEDSVWKGLSVFIVNKQGDFRRGDVSKWLNIAVNNLIAGYSTHACGTQNANPYQIPKGRLKIKNIMLDICKQYIQSGLRLAPVNSGITIPIKHLDQLIREVTGHHDDRSIKKHIQDLIKYGYITDKGYTGAFLILDTGTDMEWIERVMEQQKHDERNNKKQTESQIMENSK